MTQPAANWILTYLLAGSSFAMHAVKAQKAKSARFIILCAQHHLSSGLYFKQLDISIFAEIDRFLFLDLDAFWLKLTIR